METIYLDRLFALNLIIDYLLLTGTARVCALKLRRRRYALAAVFGALYAVLSVMPQGAFLSAAAVKLSAGIFMALIAFGSEKRFFRCATVLFAVSALFGGAVWAISLRGGDTRRGLIYLPVSMPVLALSFGLCYAALSLVFRRLGKTAGRVIHEVYITFDGRSLEIRALEDSGNTLYDPVSGSSVMVISADTLLPLFPDGAAELGTADPARQLTALSEHYGARFRLIPYTAVGTGSGMLTAFRPDAVTVDGTERDDVIAAVSVTGIAGDGFDAII